MDELEILKRRCQEHGVDLELAAALLELVSGRELPTALEDRAAVVREVQKLINDHLDDDDEDARR